MLEKYFSAPKTLARLRAGLSGPHIDGFADALERDGYSHGAALRYLRAAAHLGQFSNDDTKLPDWLAMPIRPAGGYGATICAQRRAGVDTTPWPFGPARSRPSSSASCTSSASA